MTSLVLAQLAARWGQALTLLVLSAAVTTAAVSVPLFAGSVDRAVIDNELAAGGGGDQLASVPALSLGSPDDMGSHGRAEVLAELTDFTQVVTHQIRVRGLREDQPASELHRLVARDGFCVRVDFVAGRCPLAGREVALPAPLAADVDLGAGDQVELTPAMLDDFGSVAELGPPAAITVTGVFEPQDATDPYWAAGQRPLGVNGAGAAIFTIPAGLVMDRSLDGDVLYFDAVLPGAAITPERIPALREQLAAADERLIAQPVGAQAVVTPLSGLLDRLERHGNDARSLLPVTAAPLVALGWLVVYLAVSHGISARRRELGVVAVRGTRRWTRAVAVSAESLVPALAGVPLGLAGAYLLVLAAGPRPPTGWPDGELLLAAGLAAAGTVVAVLAALWRELAAPVAQLLRQVPPRTRVAVAAAELLAVGLAVVLLVDLRVFDRDLAGVMVAAPAALMLAIAVLAARLLRPVVDLVGRRSLRRGWLGAAMAALYLARRPGATRLVVVLGLVLGMLGFAVAGAEVAGQGREAEAARQLGAERVLTVGQVSRDELLAAVRAADPDGEHAMAVTEAGGGGGPPALAVDSTRLAQVSAWSAQYGDAGPDRIAELLRPPAREPLLVGDGELTADLRPDTLPEQGELAVSLVLLPTGGEDPVVPEFGPISDTAQRQAYRTEVTGCPDGCRLAALGFTVEAAAIERVEFSLFAMEQDGTPVLGQDWLTEADRWVGRTAGDDPPGVTSPEDGLVVVHTNAWSEIQYLVFPVTAPYPVPVVTAGVDLLGNRLANVDGETVDVTVAAGLTGLPGLPGGGALMDLEHADSYTLAPGSAQSPQVWLAPDAPADIAHRLEAEGLAIVDERDTASTLAAMEQAGAPLAMRFFMLTSGLAVAVGLVALAMVVGVDRRAWRRSLHQLRTQGLARRTTARAVRWSYGVVVLAAVVAGAAAAGLAWFATGDRLPLGVDPVVLPPWPQWEPVLVPWAAVAVALLIAAVAAAGKARTEVRAWESR